MYNMAAVSLSIQSTSHFPSSFPFNKELKPKKPVLSLTLTEIADKSKPFQSLQLTVWSITHDGNRRGGRPRPAMGTTNSKGGESEPSSDGNKSPNSNDQEAIIALLRRIQSSISKGETGNAKTKSSSSSRKNAPGTRSNKGGKTLKWRRGLPKTTQREGKRADATPHSKLSRPPSNFVKRSPIPSPTPPRLMNLEQESADVGKELPFFKLSRPPSNFVKRSPIPSPTPPRLMNLEQESADIGKELPFFKLSRPPSNFVKRSPIPNPTPPRLMNIELDIEMVTNDKGLKSADIETLKLPELKEVAKARGIKGYSRLKKRELVQLLSSK